MSYIKKMIKKWNGAPFSLRIFLIGIFFLGINNGILTTTFNNYLNDYFHMDEKARGILEFPREMPGFLLIAVTGMLAAYSMRAWSVLVGIFSAIGVVGLGFMSPSVSIMIIWMFLWSMGDHLYMPIESTMGLYLSTDGKQGRRLGQISGARNFAMIFGAGIVFIAALFFKNKSLYMVLFSIAAAVALAASAFFSRVNVSADRKETKKRFVFRKEYRYFYFLNVLFGARKQIFLTFAPWVFVTVYGTKPETMAVLILIASIAGVMFRQVFGIFVDRFGEKKMFVADALILLAICMGFAFLKNIYILYFLFIFDNLMFATRIARVTYLNKISLDKGDIPASISLGITMDHLVSMTVPFLGGLLWSKFGYSYVFISASAIAFLVFFIALKVKIRKV